MTLNDYLFDEFYKKIDSILLKVEQRNDRTEVKGMLRSAEITEYPHEKGMYIYIIQEVDGLEAIITSFEQMENMIKYIKEFLTLSGGVQGSYIAYNKKGHNPPTISFRVTNTINDEAMQGKLTVRQNYSKDSSRTLNRFQNIEVSNDDPVGVMIRELMQKYEAIENVTRYMDGILNGSGEINDKIIEDIVNFYNDNRTRIIESVSATGRLKGKDIY